MTDGPHLGELEQLVMLALVRLGDDAYGMTVRREIEERTGREVSIGSVYTTLTRLEKKRLVASRLGEAAPVRGGRARRFFRVTPAGATALRRSRRMLLSMWEGVRLEPGSQTS